MEEERQRSLCIHNILRDQCVTCEDWIQERLEKFLKSPVMMEGRLRHQLGIRNENVPVFVFTKTHYGMMPRMVKSYVSMDHAASDIEHMKQHGFYTVDGGCFCHIPGSEISEVLFDTFTEA